MALPSADHAPQLYVFHQTAELDARLDLHCTECAVLAGAEFFNVREAWAGKIADFDAACGLFYGSITQLFGLS